MTQEREIKKRVRNAVLSIIVGGVIVWVLIREIDPRKILYVIGRISLWSLGISFLLYLSSIFFKAVRFKMILRTGISLKRLFPIVSLYTFFANILPMRAGELSYILLLKRQAKTPGTKSFASLIVSGTADVAVILAGMIGVGWHLRSVLKQRADIFAQTARYNLLLLAVIAVLLAAGFIALVLLERKGLNRRHRIWKYMSFVKAKILEVARELADIPLDIEILGIVACSILIIALRFGTQWYLVRSMGIVIGIWELSFALLFGVLFSLIPIHGPAGFGTVEGPWVLILSVILNVPREDAIASGFALHIIIIIYCVAVGVLGFSILGFRFAISKAFVSENRKSQIRNV